MSRYDLPDFERRVIEPLLPNKPRGVPRVDDRRVLNGIFRVLRPGAGANLLAMVQLASMRLWLRAYESTAWPMRGGDSLCARRLTCFRRHDDSAGVRTMIIGKRALPGAIIAHSSVKQERP
jgi:hypothetical protein